MPAPHEMPAHKRPWNLAIGLPLSLVLLLPVYELISTETQRPVFTPDNVWMFLALIGMAAFAFGLGLVLLFRHVLWLFVAWSQAATVFFIWIAYLGWYRRHLDYVKMGPDPGAIDQGPPEANVAGLLIVSAIWIGAAYLPLIVRALVMRLRARRPPPAAGA